MVIELCSYALMLPPAYRHPIRVLQKEEQTLTVLSNDLRYLYKVIILLRFMKQHVLHKEAHYTAICIDFMYATNL